MPCQDPGRAASEGSGYFSEYVKIREAMNAEQVKTNGLCAMLCSACRSLTKFGYDFDENPQLSVWWTDHKREDLEREEREAKQDLRRRLALELSRKPVSDLTALDKDRLREFGYL